ncbi:MAG: hypothetical protein KatS3mg003_1880 [Candidatus Nitrosocaldaceae archaeon]|nr:MAG: hypothetical protein KatS3mg003_1880 [Candidatus Nitrosocaldaceae archaeon]
MRILLLILIVMIDYAYAHYYEQYANDDIECYYYNYSNNNFDYYREDCYYYDDNFNYKYCYAYDYSYDYDNSYGYGYGNACYWYVDISINSSKYIIYDRYPLSNNDLTLYKGDSYGYHANVTLMYIDASNPSYITNAYSIIPDNISVNANEYLFDLPLNATIKTDNDIDYGYYTINAVIEYKTPYHYYHYSNHCSITEEDTICNDFSNSDNGYIDRTISRILTDFEVVRYNPKFIVYPYLSLSSNNTWSFDKQLMLAIHYLGSEDNGIIYKNRRALLNDYNNTSYGYQVLKGYDIPIINNDDIKQYLNQTIRFNMINQTRDSFNNICFNDNYIAYDNEVMFVEEGYYAMKIDYDISLNDIIDNGLADITLDANFNSNFIDNRRLFSFNYIYPSRAFNANFTIYSITDDNNDIKPLVVDRISIRFNPYNDSIALYDYILNKYNYDIYKTYNQYDHKLVDNILCLEDAIANYNRVDYIAYNTDRLNANVLYTSILISKSALMLYNTSNIYDIPLNYALTALTPYNITISITKDGIPISNDYTLPALQQYSNYVYYANNGKYDWTDTYIKRYDNTISIEPPNTFRINNLIVKYYDDKEYTDIIDNCLLGCKLSIDKRYDVWIIIDNEWHGRAQAYFYGINSTSNYYNTDMPFIFILSLIIAVSILILLRKAWNEIF